MAQPATQTQPLRNRITKALMSTPCQAVNFVFDNVVVDGSGYSFVALAALARPGAGFDIRIDPAFGSEAGYDPATNRFTFKSAGYATDDKPFQIMTLVHECTHALIDARRSRVLGLTNEACAYLAGALFNQFRIDAALPSFDGSAQPANGIYREAHELAAKIGRHIARWKYTGRYAVSASDAAPLVAAIKASSTRYTPNFSYGESGLSL